MKRISKLLLALLFALLPVANVDASTNDFYFESATFDYYLEKDADGVSILKVEEKLVAIFPEIDQNHGIERIIPYTNQDGKNRTIMSKDALDFSVTRNGITEPFSLTESTSREAYTARIGSASKYVHGRQTYVLKYQFTDVITEFDANKNNISGQLSDAVAFQELYWDTNGTGWSQRFDRLTATLHLPSDLKVEDGNAWCYVGRYGESGQDRCKISQSANKITFTTKDLLARENLTFDVQFAPGSFVVPEPEKSYILVIIAATELAIILLITIIFFTKKYLPVRDKIKWYKTAPTPPQYAPHPEFTVAQMSAIYLKNTHDPRVATMLELIVNKKIALKKTEKDGLFGHKKTVWAVEALDVSDLTREQGDLLRFVFDRFSDPEVGDTAMLTSRSYSTTLARLYEAYDKDLHISGVDKGALVSGKGRKNSSPAIGIILAFVGFQFGFGFLITAIEILAELDLSGSVLVGGLPLLLAVILAPIIALIVFPILSGRFKKYAYRTEKGLELSNYLEGLKLYIKMAETDRIKFLQSVATVDTTSAGIVKLNEKLLPYAALFGLEKSWLNELSRYYTLEGVAAPDWYDRDFSMIALNSAMHSALARPVDPSSYSSGSGGSSSGSSGGGGGGHSGGGGGGGGGGGW